MASQPTIRTERLTLRPFRLADAPEVRRLAGVKSVASMTMRIPYPYEKGMAEKWIRTHKRSFDRRKSVVYAVIRRKTGKLIGAVGLMLFVRPWFLKKLIECWMVVAVNSCLQSMEYTFRRYPDSR